MLTWPLWLLPPSRLLFKEKCWDDDITHTVMSSLPYIHALVTTWAPASKVVTPLYYWSIWRILAPTAEVLPRDIFFLNSTDPCEEIESWNGSIAQFLDEQNAKQKWRHYPTVTTLPLLTVRQEKKSAETLFIISYFIVAEEAEQVNSFGKEY